MEFVNFFGGSLCPFFLTMLVTFVEGIIKVPPMIIIPVWLLPNTFWMLSKNARLALGGIYKDTSVNLSLRVVPWLWWGNSSLDLCVMLSKWMVCFYWSKFLLPYYYCNKLRHRPLPPSLSSNIQFALFWNVILVEKQHQKRDFLNVPESCVFFFVAWRKPWTFHEIHWILLVNTNTEQNFTFPEFSAV